MGKFQYSCSGGGGSWIDVDVTNTRPVGKTDFIDVVYLKPSDKIRFQMNGNKYWTKIQGNSLITIPYKIVDVILGDFSLFWSKSLISTP